MIACPVPCVSFAMVCQQLLNLSRYIVVGCCIIFIRVSFDSLSGLVAFCYQFAYLFCPVWFVPACVSPWGGLLSSAFYAPTYFAVVLVGVFPELHAL